ncbi:integumentary mucin C.1-like [Mizuhopecten yessoensis]|uniref:integumentary mucin C.1-like n=1 Tax=Mizuhopecten yessoensis TaxID=6573 RepID=UPI000B459CCB|nr:integumentary mucin C.1-like [Mizuhopecten yessoensis]
MKGIVIVFVVLISVTYGTKFCEVTKKENDTCGKNGKCTIPICVATTTVAPATTPTTKATTPSQAKSTSTTSTKATTTTTTPITVPVSGRKRRAATAPPAIEKCKSTCNSPGVCKYQCTGESGSIKHGLSPLILLVGVFTKLFLVG